MTPITLQDSMTTFDHTLNLLHQMIGEDKSFRPGQWEAIETVAVQKQRALVVQRTGWGKSMVYFLATKLLREQGCCKNRSMAHSKTGVSRTP